VKRIYAEHYVAVAFAAFAVVEAAMGDIWAALSDVVIGGLLVAALAMLRKAGERGKPTRGDDDVVRLRNLLRKGVEPVETPGEQHDVLNCSICKPKWSKGER
jgi:hypothetical protein